MVVLYAITGHGVTVGFHRYLTHGAFKAKRPCGWRWRSPAAWRSRAR